MSRKEVPRAGLLKVALAGKITNVDGALALHLSVRQCHRVKVRFAAEGAALRVSVSHRSLVSPKMSAAIAYANGTLVRT